MRPHRYLFVAFLLIAASLAGGMHLHAERRGDVTIEADSVGKQRQRPECAVCRIGSSCVPTGAATASSVPVRSAPCAWTARECVALERVPLAHGLRAPPETA